MAKKNNSRKLASVLFADIVGYSAMMQASEKKAAAALKRFQSDLKKMVAHERGQIVNFYGDGALVVFDTTLQAMIVAVNLQESFRAKNIPVRIGVHSGPVVFAGDQVYGDSVNLASRIESIGIPGSVLLSKRVRNDVKNQQEFDAVSLGEFQFKNIDDVIEVFALKNNGFPVPDKNKLKWRKKASKKEYSSSIPSVNKWLWIFAMTSFVVIAALMWFDYTQKVIEQRRVNQLTEKSIAVLPFKNLSNDPEQEYFSDGISEDILTNLARIADLKVIARTSAFSFKGGDKTIPEIANELAVAYVLEGSVRREEDKIRITTQLVHAPSGTVKWVEDYDRNFKDIFALQTEVSLAIVDALKAELTPKETELLNHTAQVNPEAYNLWLKANHLLQGFNPFLYEDARESLEKAIEIDPNYADAHADMAFYYISRGTWVGDLSALEARSKALPFLEKALALNPELGNAYTYMGMINLWFEWDFTTSEEAFETSRKLNGNPYLNRVSLWNSLYQGEFDSAKVKIKIIKDYDPLAPFVDGFSGIVAFYEKKYEKAEKLLKQSTIQFPEIADGHRFLSRIYLKQKKYKKALKTLENGLEKMEGRPPMMLGYLAVAYYKNGKKSKSKEVIEELTLHWEDKKQGSPAFFTGMAYANMGEIDQAFEWLQKAYEAHEVEMLWLKSDPLSSPLHGDERYQELLDKVSFPKTLKK